MKVMKDCCAAVNKWLIGHAEGGLPEGSFIGLKGENIEVWRYNELRKNGMRMRGEQPAEYGGRKHV